MIKPIRNTGLRLEQLDDMAVILDLKRKQLLHINTAATRVWMLCDGLHSVDDIVAEVGADASDKHLLRRDVQLLLGQMAHNGLVRDFGTIEEGDAGRASVPRPWPTAAFEESPSILSVTLFGA